MSDYVIVGYRQHLQPLAANNVTAVEREQTRAEQKCSTAGMGKRMRRAAASSDLDAANTTAVPNIAPGTQRININNLPDELLLGIFTSFSFNKLIDVIQHVCVRWKRLVHDPLLWHDKEYIIGGWAMLTMSCCGRYCSKCPHCRCEKTDEEVLRTADMVPQLRMLTMMRDVDAQILRKICRNCPNLRTLQFNVDQKMSYSLLSYIFEKCPKIEELKIADSLLSDQRYAELVSRLEQLRSLKVICNSNRNKAEPVPLRFLADNCPRLQEIDLGSWEQRPLEDIEYFVRVKREVLVSATMRWSMVGERCVVPVLREAACRLERLRLHYCGVRPRDEAAAFGALGQLHNLRELTCRYLSLQQRHLICLAFQPGCLPLLQKLHLTNTFCLSDNIITTISQGCPALRDLRLMLSTTITDGALTEIHCLKHLQILDLSSENGLGGSAVAHIAQLPALRTLILRGTGDLRRLQPGLRHVLDMQELRCLDILYCDGIEAVPFAEFPGALVNLRELHVTIKKDELLYKKVFADLQCRMPDLRLYTSEEQKMTT